MSTELISSECVLDDVTVDRLESDAGLFEVVHGEIVEKPLSAFTTWLATELVVHLANWVKAHELGWIIQEAVFILDDDRLNQPRPDIAFVSTVRWPLDRLPPYHGYWQVAPNLAIEVVSPSDRFEDVVGKAEMYLEAGVEEVWLVIPRTRSVMVYRSGNQVAAFHAGQMLKTPLIPDWTLDVGSLIPVTTPDPAAPAA